MTPDDTEIMSQYLQRGATMLGDHCDDCGNPLFRVQGDELCVVCRSRDDDAGDRRGAAETAGDGEGGGGDRGDAGGGAEGGLTGGGVREGVEEVRRNVLAVARRVSRDARDERELARLRDQMAVLESCADVLDDLG